MDLSRSLPPGGDTMRTMISNNGASSVLAGTADHRIRSIDLMRGLVILLMALDHARDFSSPTDFDPTDLSRASPALFLTRWITHFCAPTFVFLAGTSAFLQQAVGGLNRRRLQAFLVTRGGWLIFLEVTVVSFSWRFDAGGVTLQVIWALGWAMEFLALLLYLPKPAIVAIGAAIVLLHNALDGLHSYSLAPGHPVLAGLWAVLHESRTNAWDATGRIVVLYPLIPWIGLMALGYGFGPVLALERPRRVYWMRWLGISVTALFVALRLSGLYGDSHVWTSNPRGPLFTGLEFLNTTKYPPSLQYLLMTLGPVLLLLPLLETWRGRLAGFVQVFGRVPMFFYLIHVPLLHLVAVSAAQLLYGARPEDFVGKLPAGYAPSLLRVYLAWAALLAGMYPVCRWFGRYKSHHRGDRWLSYL